MKTLSISVALLVSTLGLNAQESRAMAGKPSRHPEPAQEATYAVAERGAHHRVWQKVTREEDGQGGTTLCTNVAYVELATGMHYQEGGQWREAKEEFELLPGRAVARQGQHRVSLKHNLNSAGAVEMEMPDGQRLRSHVLGLSYFDTASGDTVLIAEVKDCVGTVVGNRVIYEDAFMDLQADVRYTYTRAGFEQDIILRAQPPRPEEYGLNPETTRLQVLTEFVTPPQPGKRLSKMHDRKGMEMNDEELDFGTMCMVRGKAFSLGREQNEIPVGKQWLRLEGRNVLVEEVAVPDLDDELKGLPAAAGNAVKPAPGSPQHRVSQKRLLPGPRLAREDKGQMKVASASASGPGLVLDYIVTINANQPGGYTFRGDTTYLVSASAVLSGTVTFEGGTVIKYVPNTSLTISSGATIRWLATEYRPVIFTARDDDSVGEMVAGSTHNPDTGVYYANPALYFSDVPNVRMTNFRIAFASAAIKASYYNLSVYLAHGQFVKCSSCLTVPGQGSVVLRNLLFSKFGVAMAMAYANVQAQHVTFDGKVYTPSTGPSMLLVPAGPPTVSLNLVNCVVANVTMFMVGNPGSIGGNNNGFYNCGWDTVSTFGSNPYLITENPFQTKGAGNYYLVDGYFRDWGVTTIDAGLLNELKKKTTYPPADPPAPSPMGATWYQTVLRDNDGYPDLGYHYDPLDYWVSQYAISGAPYTLGAGVAVGFYGTTGFTVGGGGLNIQGQPDSMNRLVWYPSVQEQPVKINSISTAGSRMITPGGAPTMLTFQFTDMAMQGLRQTFLHANVPRQMPRVMFQDCQLRGLTMIATRDIVNVSPVAYVSLKNCLLERCSLDMSSGTAAYSYPGGTYYYQNPMGLSFYNNLFWNCSVGLAYYETQDQYHAGYTIKDNLFDSSTVNLGGDGNYLAYVFRSNNGYNNTPPGQLSGSGDVTLTTLSYAAGPRGPWYLGSSAPTLADAGSRTATQAGLNGYTMRLDQTPEGGSQVDIGYHYFPIPAPTANDIYGLQGCRRANLSLTLSGSDPSGLSLTYTVLSGPSHGTVSSGSGANRTYRANNDYEGPDSFTYKVSNGYLDSAPATVYIEVGYPPYADYQYVPACRSRDEPITLTGWDSCDDPLTFSVLDAPDHGTLIGTAPSLIYRPNPGHYEGPDSFTFKVNDGVRDSAEATVWIEIGGAPVADNQTFMTDLGRAIYIALTGSDGCDDPLTFSIVDAPTLGTLTGTAPYLTYQPNLAGLDSFTFKANDGNYDSAPGTIAVAVIPPPEFHASCRENRIVLNWGIPEWLETMGIVTDFVIRRSTSPTGEYTTIATPDAYTRQYIDSAIVPGTTYYYILSFHYDDGGVTKESLSSDVVISTCPVNEWGPTDIAFIIDNTGSMSPSIDTILNGIAAVLDDIVTSSGGDYRLALLTPENTGTPETEEIDIHLNFTDGNRTDFETELSLLFAWDGGGWAESTDECLNTAVHALPASGRPQNVDFAPQFRSNVRKLVVLITDAPPGGFDDYYNPQVDGVNAHQLALDAAADGIKINAVMVGYDGTARPVMQDYASTTSGWYSQISSSGVGIIEAIREMLYSGGGGPGPAIVTQPQSQETVVGANVTFSVVATGAGTLRYQWIHNNVTLGTGSSLTLNNVQPADAGTYFVIVSDAYGSVMSDPATLTVRSDPTILVHPASKVVVAGGNASFEVVAIGTAPLTYQWYHGVSPVGSGGATLLLNNVHYTDEGEYYVVVTSPAGSVESQHATLTVLNVAEIEALELELSSDIVPPGSSVSFVGKARLTSGQEYVIANPSIAIAPIGATYGAVPAVGSGSIVFPRLSKLMWTYVEGDVEGRFAYTDPGDPNFAKERGGAYRLTMTLPGCPLTAEVPVIALPSGTAEITAAEKSYTDQLGRKLVRMETAADLKNKPEFQTLRTELAGLGHQPYFDSGQLQINQVDLPVDGMPVSASDMVAAGLGNSGDGATLSSVLSSMASQLNQVVERIHQIDPANLTQADADELNALVNSYGALSQQFDALNPSAVGVKEASAELNALMSGAIPQALDALREKSIQMADAAIIADLGWSDWWRALTEIFGAASNLNGWLRGNQIKAGIILANSLANVMLANLINWVAPAGLDYFSIYASAASGFACPLWDGLDGTRLAAVEGFSTYPMRNAIVLVGCIDPGLVNSMINLTRGLMYTPNLNVTAKLKILIEILKVGKSEYEWLKSVSGVPPYWLSTGLFAVGFPERVEPSFIDEGLDLVSPQGWPKVAQGSYGCVGTVVVFNIQDFLFHAENVWFLPNCNN